MVALETSASLAGAGEDMDSPCCQVLSNAAAILNNGK